MDAIPSGDSAYQRFGNHYRRRVVPLVTPRSKAIITVSEYEKSRIVERLGIRPERIQVIYNGINEMRFHANYDQNTKAGVRKKYGLPQDFILFIGNQSFRKNSGRAIEAYVRYASTTPQPMPLVTPGLPQKVVAEKLKELKYPYTREQFITPGYISDIDLPVLYGLSTIFLFPSLSEGFGMPIVEAMACGSPVITSRISCMPEIAGGAGILADPYDTENLSQAMVLLANNEALRLDKIAAGIENARRFSWDQAARKILSIYETVYSDARKEQKVPGFFHKHVFATRN
jgi:glycosyltransferase involved in cell wall biosynthesis